MSKKKARIETSETVETSGVETYEMLYTQLQDILARLEGGDLPLEELLQLYEQGIELAAACQRMLDAAELRVQEVQVRAQNQAE